jgi:dihydrofolate synthase/folylpolyglutamate synthase
MAYAEELARLYALESRGIRMGASRMAEALGFRGHPERGQRFVHVGGTNGKGSVSSMIASCLVQAGYRTGLFTSPHMHRYVERVRIDGRPLGERETAGRLRELLAAFEGAGAPDTTFFELTTLLALEAFRDHGCDLVVLEVGLGGRLDATNAVTPEVAVITRVALDHTRILGDTVGQIAREKAGIIKRGVPLVTAVRDPAARRVIGAHARRLGVEVAWIDRDFAAVADVTRGRARFGVRVGERVVSGLRTRLAGEHQRENAASAVAALQLLRERGFAVSDAAIRRGLARVRWPGRLERVAGKPSFLFDAAHNLDGCISLERYLREEDRWRRRPGARRVLVFGAMADKQYGPMLRLLAPLFDRIVFSPPAMRRAAGYAQLRKHAPGVVAGNVAAALVRARRAAGVRGEVVVAGSIFLVADARARVLGLRGDPQIRM